MLLHNNNILCQIKEMENRELPLGFFLIQNLILCFVLFCSQRWMQRLHSCVTQKQKMKQMHKGEDGRAQSLLCTQQKTFTEQRVSRSQTQRRVHRVPMNARFSSAVASRLLADSIHPLSFISLVQSPNQTLNRVTTFLNT